MIPAIITNNFEEIKEKMKLAGPYVKWIQIDVGDGEFVPNKTFLDLARFSEIKTSLKKEAHLMVKDPENYIEQCKEGGFQRIIFHIEAIQIDTDKKQIDTDKNVIPSPDDHRDEESRGKALLVVEVIKEQGMEAGIALNPETEINIVESFVDKADIILFLGVNPGFSGQKFQPQIIQKIKILRDKYPDINIAVDGGMNPETAKKAVQAGANIIVSASYVWESGNIEKAIEELKT